MRRMLRSLVVMGVVASMGFGMASGPTGSSASAQIPKKGATAKGKGKPSKKGTEPKAEAAPSMESAGGMKFSRDIAPILVANCVGCHNDKHRSGLNQTTFDSLLKGGKSGKAIVPGNPDESLLIARIKGDDGPKMPPGGQRDLSEASIAKISEWIKDGARLDAGRDPAAPLAKYASTPEDVRREELARLAPDERDKKTEATARERLKKADPKGNPELTTSPHFLLFSDLPKERATNLLKSLEAQQVRIGRTLGLGRGTVLAGPEKISLFVFKDQKGYTEFVRTIENQDSEADEQARGKLNVESPYLVARDPLAGGDEPAPNSTVGSPARKGGRREEASTGPERSLAGLLTEVLTSGALAQLGKAPRWLTTGVGALMASSVEPRSPYYGKIRREAYAIASQGWTTKASEALGGEGKAESIRAVGFAVAEWLASTNPSGFVAFVHAMGEGGDKLDDAIQKTLQGNREQFLSYSGGFVEQNYGRSR